MAVGGAVDALRTSGSCGRVRNERLHLVADLLVGRLDNPCLIAGGEEPRPARLVGG